MYSFDVTKLPKCSRFGRMMQKNGWERSEKRSLPENLFVFIIDGQACFWIGGDTFLLRQGDVLIIPADMPYRANTQTFCEYYFCHFDGKLEKEHCLTAVTLPRKFSFALPQIQDPKIYFPLYGKLAEDFRRVWDSMAACTDYQARGTAVGQRMLECEFLKVLLILAEHGQNLTGGEALPAALSRMIVYIKKNLTRPLCLEDVCSHCSISPSYAGRLFRKHMNITATEYINSEKLYYARELMSSTGMTLSQIAEYLGYCDVYYFSKRFKRKFGKAPSQMAGK